MGLPGRTQSPRGVILSELGFQEGVFLGELSFQEGVILSEAKDLLFHPAPQPRPRAFLLAGGQSSRMGRDKAQLIYSGRSLLDHALDKLRRAGFTPAIAGLRSPTHAFLPDNFPESGPLGGIEAALHSLAGEPRQPVLFMPVDLPLLPANFLSSLFERAAITGALATLPFAQGRPQPLCAVYHSSLAPGIRLALEGGDRKVMRVLRALAGPALDTPQIEALAPLHGWQPHRWFLNLNTPEDYARLQAAGTLETQFARGYISLMSKRNAATESLAIPAGLRITGPMTGTESFASDGHAGEYLLALVDPLLPLRLGREVREQQGQKLLRGVREFLDCNPEFALVGSQLDLLELIRLTDGYANIWLWRKDL